MVVAPAGRGTLSRAGWGVLSGTSLPGIAGVAPDAEKGSSARGMSGSMSLPRLRLVASPRAEADGKRLVSEVVASWSKRYIYTIRQGGLKDGCFTYECLFSRPTSEHPVPGIVITVHFQLLPPSAGQAPRLLFSFEEGELRHEWALVQDSNGKWRASKGQQRGSLKAGYFESYLDAYIKKKETVRSNVNTRGLNVVTAFEESRLTPPPAFTYDEDEREEVDTPAPTGMAPRRSAAMKIAKSERFKTTPGRLDNTAGGAVVEVVPTQRILDRDAMEMAKAMKVALRKANMYCDKVPLPSSMDALLVNIFDAADEDSAGELAHHEVTRLLMATLPGFGLEEWDIHNLLTNAKESITGFIEFAPFIEAAPDIIAALRARRATYRRRGLPGVEIPPDAMKQCIGDEVSQTVEALTRAFNDCVADDAGRGLFMNPLAHHGGRRASISGRTRALPLESQTLRLDEAMLERNEDAEERVLVALKRRHARDCINSLIERISPQEAKMLMQMLPEDENGYVHIDDLPDQLERLRTQALLNAVVECDPLALRKHLVMRFRDIGMTEDAKVKVWHVKNALLGADQVCLSRLQIHTLLCLANPDSKGDVDVHMFLAICSAIIPHMSNARIFKENAERLEQEQAEAAKERQNAELAALGAARVNKKDDGEEEVSEKKIEVDQDTVERVLIQVFSLGDDTRKPIPVLPAQTIFNFIFNSSDQQVLSCGLDELEAVGLLAEMAVDANGEVAYHDFVKRWVPIMFEIRRNLLLSAYLQVNASDKLGIPEPDPVALETLFPLQEGKFMRKVVEPSLTPVSSPKASKESSNGLRGGKWGMMRGSAIVIARMTNVPKEM